MINKVTMFIVLVILCVYALVGCQQPPHDYPDDEPAVKEEVDDEPERGYPKQSKQQPPRDYPDDNRDDGNSDQNTMP